MWDGHSRLRGQHKGPVVGRDPSGPAGSPEWLDGSEQGQEWKDMKSERQPWDGSHKAFSPWDRKCYEKLTEVTWKRVT